MLVCPGRRVANVGVVSTDIPHSPAGWYPDPQGSGGQRWWDGTAWTEHTHPAAPAAPAPAHQPTPATPPAAGQYTPTAGPPAAQPYPGATPYVPGPPIGSWRSHLDDRPMVTGMGSAIRTVFQKYARFDGRAGRPEFWYWTLFNVIVAGGAFLLIILAIVPASVTMGTRGVNGGAAAIAGLLYVLLILWGLAVIVPNLAVLVRRLRDGGFHWALIFLMLVPGGSIALLVLATLPSKYP